MTQSITSPSPERASSQLADSSSLPPLHRAAKDGQVALLHQLLSEKKTNVNAKDSFGSTALHLAAFHGHLEAVSALLSYKEIDINCEDVFHRTPAFYAARNGHDVILELLISKGASVNHKTDKGETPLHKASYYGHLKCLRILLAHKEVKINEVEPMNGNTPLHNVASRGHLECLKYLLDRGADINARNLDLYTPLHLAVIYKQEGCVKALIARGAQLDTVNKKNRSPIDDAMKQGYKEIASLLKRSVTLMQVEQMKQKDLLKWTCQDVVQWISLLGFPQYKESFLANDINGQTLQSLTISTLKNELQINSFGHRTTIIQEVGKLYKEYHDKKAKEKSNNNNVIHLENDIETDDEVWHIKYDDLEMGDLLGKGYFGEVRKALWKGAEVAVKVIYRDSLGQKDLNVFYKELSIISKLRHPNVLMFLGACMQGGNKCLVTEYLSGGSLHQLIHNNLNTLDRMPHLRNRIMCDIIKGMTYLHDLKILHRDLTPKNLLLDSNMNCKVSDFGLSRIREDSGDMTTSVGCLPYQAPEVFRGERYSDSADVFSFGMVVYEMVSGQEPHQDMQALKFANMVAYDHYRPKLPDCQDTYRKIITMCWNSERNKRPSFKQLFQEASHPAETKFDAVKTSSLLPENTAFDYTDTYDQQ